METPNVTTQSTPLSSRGIFGLTIKSATIVLATLIIFFQDLYIIFNNALQSESTSYLLAIPIIFIYLMYRKRKMIRAVIPIETTNNKKRLMYIPQIIGILVSISAILLYWGGSYTFTPLEYHLLALPFFVIGLTLILFNIKTTRQLAFPIAFLFFLIPPPSSILYSFGSTLSMISSEASYSIINALKIPSTLVNEIGKPIIIQITRANGTTSAFAVDIACSGIYSILAFVVFIVLILYMTRDKPWKKLTIFLIGFPIFIILNIIRITIILLIGYSFGEETALTLFHLLGGWFLIFVGTLLVLTFSEKILKTQILAKSKQNCEKCNPKNNIDKSFCNSCGRILKPFPLKFQNNEIIKIVAILLSAFLLVSIQIPVFTMTEVSAQIIVQTPSGEEGGTQLLPTISNYTLQYLYRDREFEKVAKQDASLVYVYRPLDESKETIWVAIEIGSADSKLHNWEYCLISWNGQSSKIIQLDLKEIPLQEPSIITRYFAFQNQTNNQTQVVLYWKTEATFITGETSENKYVKISLITYPTSPQNLTKPEKLLPFATAIANNWESTGKLSPITLFLSKNGIYLSAVTCALVAIVIALYTFEKMKMREKNIKAYQKLSTPNKEIINIVLETEKTKIPTLSEIAVTYKNKIGKAIDKKELLYRLSEGERAGIIKRDITNNLDTPTQIWKTYMHS